MTTTEPREATWSVHVTNLVRSLRGPRPLPNGQPVIGRPELPPLALRPETVAPSMAKVEAWVAKRDAARTERDALAIQAHRAGQLDREAAQAAVMVDNPMPTATEPKARAKLETAERSVPAIEAGLETAVREMAEAFNEHGGDWLTEADDAYAAALDEYAQTVEQLAAKIEAVRAASFLPEWLRRIRDEESVRPFQPRRAELPSYWARRPMEHTALVVDALRADVETRREAASR